jgi:cell division protein FtsN
VASPPPTGEARPPSIARAGGWTVQANPTRSREDAEGLQRQLHGRGYDASIVRVLRDGDTWYRVQVGHFATSEQATEVMQKLREREGVSHAFVASE